MDRLFTMDEEDKINLEVETPSATSKDSIEEDDASQIYYMVYFSFNSHLFVCLSNPY